MLLKHILFFGNSLTAGYGVNPNQAFPALIGRRIDSLHLAYQVTNAGLSGGKPPQAAKTGSAGSSANPSISSSSNSEPTTDYEAYP